MVFTLFKNTAVSIDEMHNTKPIHKSIICAKSDTRRFPLISSLIKAAP
jgi:hypothetical protein